MVNILHASTDVFLVPVAGPVFITTSTTFPTTTFTHLHGKEITFCINYKLHLNPYQSLPQVKSSFGSKAIPKSIWTGNE